MKLMIIRNPSGQSGSGHVSLIAWDDSIEDKLIDKLSQNKIKAVHLDFYGADIKESNPLRLKRLKSLQALAEDDNHIILSSNKNFTDFLAVMNNSNYKYGYSFNMAFNNCVHSVLFALNAADIKLPINKERSCKYLCCCLFAYTNIIKPVELMKAAKDYKNNNADEKSLQIPNKKLTMQE